MVKIALHKLFIQDSVRRVKDGAKLEFSFGTGVKHTGQISYLRHMTRSVYM